MLVWHTLAKDLKKNQTNQKPSEDDAKLIVFWSPHFLGALDGEGPLAPPLH